MRESCVSMSETLLLLFPLLQRVWEEGEKEEKQELSEEAKKAEEVSVYFLDACQRK